MFTIENEFLSATINPKGAELTSLIHKSTGQEFLWSGDAAFWGKHSPVLFPIVGTLKNDRFIYKDQSYQLGRHGFAREKKFEVGTHTATSLTLTLNDDEETLKLFPFHFRLYLIYQLEEQKLSLTYLVNNLTDGEMYFSVGGHPAFKVPLNDELSYVDYYLQFNKSENAGRWPISKDGLLETTPVDLMQGSDKLPLSKKLFEQDALVIKNMASSEVKLICDKDSAGFTFNYDGFPFLGIWAAKGADFVCIEPWCGVADSVDSSQKIEEKEGIVRLEKSEKFERTWSVEISASL
ncbi:MAG: aldose 1-epimerase family protein [Ferruginibacter sp.]|nr:aldose 1-epimerase family protein [Ferruginibacter sp.]